MRYQILAKYGKKLCTRDNRMRSFYQVGFVEADTLEEARRVWLSLQKEEHKNPEEIEVRDN